MLQRFSGFALIVSASRRIPSRVSGLNWIARKFSENCRMPSKVSGLNWIARKFSENCRIESIISGLI